MEEFVTAAVFSYPHEITILKHLLEEAGIRFVFRNETMASVAPMYSFALGGIRLMVHPNDMDTVKQILSNLENNSNLTIV